MVDISPVNPQSINVSISGNNDVNANTNADAQLAYSWAVGQGLIQGIDYSAKYYAGKAKESEEIATETVSNIESFVEDAQGYAQNASNSADAAETSEDNAQIWAEGDDEDVEELGGTHSAKGWAEYVVDNAPTVTVEQTATGATVTATDLQGTTTATILNGSDGADGSDGVSPVATVTQTATGATISITDANGTTTADITNGTDGTNGSDGFSPVANISKSGSTATITITDGTGTTTATITDGQDGQDGADGQDGSDGQDGFSPIATVTKSGTTATITITDKNGTTTANVYDGSGSVSDVKVNDVSVLDGSVAKINLTNYFKNSALSTATNSIGIGSNTLTSAYSILIGSNAHSSGVKSVTVGDSATAGPTSVALGYNAETSNDGGSIAIGYDAITSADNAIQLGAGTNSTRDTFQVGRYTLLGSGGYIPDARLSNNIARTSAIPSISNLADKALSNLSAIGEAHFQTPLNSGNGIYIDGSNDINIVQTSDYRYLWSTTTQGTLTEVDGVYSGFSQNDYLFFNYTNSSISKFEASFTFTTGNDIQTWQAITGQANGQYNYKCPQFEIEDGKVDIVMSSNGTTWDGYLISSNISTNTNYTLYVLWEGSTITATLTNNDAGTSENLTVYSGTGSISAINWTIGMAIGLDVGYASAFGGSIDLGKSYIKINDSLFHISASENASPAKATSSLYGLVKPDNDTITVNDGIISSTGADTDLSNITSTAKQIIARNSAPSLTSISIPLNSSGVYAASGAGEITVKATCTGQGGLYISSYTNSERQVFVAGLANGYVIYSTFRVNRQEYIQVSPVACTVDEIWFIPDKGEI